MGELTALIPKRIINLVSTLAAGYSSTEINIAIQKVVNTFEKPDGIDVRLTGETEDQKETGAFLGKASTIRYHVGIFILITQLIQSVSRSLF